MVIIDVLSVPATSALVPISDRIAVSQQGRRRLKDGPMMAPLSDRQR